MPSVAEKLISLEEFLPWEREQPERYAIGIDVSLDTIYEDTELDAIRPREGGQQTPAV